MLLPSEFWKVTEATVSSNTVFEAAIFLNLPIAAVSSCSESGSVSIFLTKGLLLGLWAIDLLISVTSSEVNPGVSWNNIYSDIKSK